MYKNNEELNIILEELLKNQENECVEFKRAENNFDIDNLGRYFSALGNEANLKNKQYSWIIFGVDDKTHELTNTNFYKDGNFNLTINSSVNYLLLGLIPRGSAS